MLPRSHRRTTTALALALTALALPLTGCASPVPGPASHPTGSTTQDTRPVVLTTITVLADIAQNIAGPHLQVESITKVGAEIHGYEPTPGDIARAAQADLILDNGLGLEAWFEKFVADIDVPHVVVSERVEPLTITSDADAGKPNPHAWMSPRMVQEYTHTISDAFAELSPEHASDFAARAGSYREELQQVQNQLVQELEQLPASQRALVTCEGAFSYLARDAGLEEQFIWPVNAEQQATPRQIAETIEFVKRNEVPAVFCESTVSDAPMQQVVAATEASYGGTLYVDSLSSQDGPVPTYLDLIRHDAHTIAAALTEARP